MTDPSSRLAPLSVLTMLCACAVQQGPDQTLVAAPSAKEEEILNLVLADMHEMDESSCVEAIMSTTNKLFWPYALSFGDGELARAGDARFDEVALLQTRAKPERPVSLRMPDQASRLGFRVVENANTVSSCRARFTLHAPLFDGNFAVVATDVQVAAMPGGDTRIRVLRFRGGRWESYAYGSSSWGRPII